MTEHSKKFNTTAGIFILAEAVFPVCATALKQQAAKCTRLFLRFALLITLPEKEDEP